MRAHTLGWIPVVASLVAACGTEISVFQTSGGAGGGGAGDTGASGPSGPGGAGGAGGETTTVSVGGQGGGVGCVDDTPCLIDALCMEGFCDPNTNTCAVAPLPAGTSCGPDASCDGVGNCATGDVEWAKTFGDGGDQRAHEVAADSQGNAIITGQYQGVLDLGGTPLDSGNSQDAYLAKLDPSGNLLWSHGFAGFQQDWGWDVVVDSADNVIVAGYFYGQIDLGAGTMTSAGQRDIFVAKFSPNGTLSWAKQYGGSAEELLRTVAVGPSGEVVIAGYWYTGNVVGSTLSFGPDAVYANSDPGFMGELDVFVAKLDADGDHLWSLSAGDGAEQRIYDVVVDSAGNVAVSGLFHGAIDFGGGAITSAGGADAFVAKLDASGAHVFSSGFGDGASQSVRGIDVDAADNLVIAGSTSGAIDLGGGPLTASEGFDLFVAKLDPQGAHLASAIFGGAGDTYSNDLAVDLDGHVVISGSSDGSPDFGGGPLTTLGGHDAIVVKLASDLTPLWSRAFGATNTQVAHGVAVDPTGVIFAAGYFGTAIDFGMGPVSSAGSADVFVAKLSP